MYMLHNPAGRIVDSEPGRRPPRPPACPPSDFCASCLRRSHGCGSGLGGGGEDGSGDDGGLGGGGDGGGGLGGGRLGDEPALRRRTGDGAPETMARRWRPAATRPAKTVAALWRSRLDVASLAPRPRPVSGGSGHRRRHAAKTRAAASAARGTARTAVAARRPPGYAINAIACSMTMLAMYRPSQWPGGARVSCRAAPRSAPMRRPMWAGRYVGWHWAADVATKRVV